MLRLNASASELQSFFFPDLSTKSEGEYLNYFVAISGTEFSEVMPQVGKPLHILVDTDFTMDTPSSDLSPTQRAVRISAHT